MNEEKKQKYENGFVKVEIHQLEWPKVLSSCIPLEVLKWIVFEDFSEASMKVAASRRIHVIAKPRTRKEEYWVVGGFIYYLHLLTKGWDKQIECVFEEGGDHKKIQDYFLNDINLSIFATKGGSVANALRAALLIPLSGCDNSVRTTQRISAPNSLLKKRDRAILKELAGFDNRAYTQSSKEGVPKEVLEFISEILKLNKSKKPIGEQAGNSELLTDNE